MTTNRLWYQCRILVVKLDSTWLYFLGEMVTKQPLIRSMRTVKRETLKLISGWVSRSNDPQMVSEMLCFLFFELMLYSLEYSISLYAFSQFKGNLDVYLWYYFIAFYLLESLSTLKYYQLYTVFQRNCC